MGKHFTQINLKKSQVFLKNPIWILKYLRFYFLKEFPLIEIGPGRGDVTRFLLSFLPPSNFLAVEKDLDFCKKLWSKKIRVLCLDFLNLKDTLLDHKQIFGSLPYQGSKKIVRKIADSNFRSALLIVQKEVLSNLMDPLTRSGLYLKERVSIFKLKSLNPKLWRNPPKVWGSLFYMIPK